jgi:pSer/pThr/pTyr-binding forkhead associated (FHA) protein
MPIDADVVIGRADADLTIEDSELSRRHVLLRPVDGGVEIQDLDSTNGTLVNGERISSPVVVGGGASIELGDTRIAVEVEGEQPPPAAAAPAASEPGGGGGSRRGVVIAAIVAVVVIAAAVALLAGGGSDEVEARTLDAQVTAPSLVRDEAFQVSGRMTGEPLGDVAVVIQRRLGGALVPGGPPVSVRGFLLVEGPDGAMSLNFDGDLGIDESGRESLDARGTAANGTQDYAEVEGTFHITGGRPNGGARVAEYTIDGELEY